MGDKSKKDKEKTRKQKIVKESETAKKAQEKLCRQVATSEID